jgi:hypothetical protein
LQIADWGQGIADCGTEWNDIACHRRPAGTLRRQRALRIGEGGSKAS